MNSYTVVKQTGDDTNLSASITKMNEAMHGDSSTITELDGRTTNPSVLKTPSASGSRAAAIYRSYDQSRFSLLDARVISIERALKSQISHKTVHHAGIAAHLRGALPDTHFSPRAAF